MQYIFYGEIRVEIINIFSSREKGKILLSLGSDVFFYILSQQARMFKSQTAIS
jgi:hypothetical protein